MDYSRFWINREMDKLQAMMAFREVARLESFAAAARALNTSPPSISRLIGDLECDLGVRLFQRSTRKVGLTEEGEIFLRRGASLLDELETVSDELRDRRKDPRGQLRISSVVAFGQERIAAALPGFMAKHPNISVELEISNRAVDLVQEHFDLAIRIGNTNGLESSGLKARKIFEQRLGFVATPDYIGKYGTPKNLEDLSQHRIVKQVSGNWGRNNRFQRNGDVVNFSLPETFVVNSPNAARNAILTGDAMGLLADYLTQDLIAGGRLVRVMPELETVPQPIFAVFVHRNYMPAKVRAFLDHIVEWLGPNQTV